MSGFFIDRPVFAWVIGLILMLVGGLSVSQLPIAQYPSIAPPQISIAVTYPGASAQVVDDTVVRPIQQLLSGLDGLEYISSSSQSSGAMEIDATFRQGTDPNIAQVQVQNKLSLAESSLPQEVTAQGIKVTKATRSFFLVVAFRSEDGSMSGADVADYIASTVEAPISRIPGVGDYTLFGSEYAMRIWLDPSKLFNYGLTVADVTGALAAQNVQVAAGEIGGLPALKGQRLDATIIGPSRLERPEDFEKILLRVNPGGSRVLLGDVARVQLGSQSYAVSSKINNQPASGIALKLAVGANQVTTEKAVKDELNRLMEQAPPGLRLVYPLDTEPFIILSITEVVITLAEAIVLVFAVMYIFLQNFRATLIPTIAVPVVLLGTFGVLAALGYTINTLTMLAMVLAVGLLVDDAIVVVENVSRVMEEEHLPPREATRKSMAEIQGALVGIALVLSAVFLPMAFLAGSTGVIYRQFSITIVAAMGLSVLVALILTPALCATLLKPKDPHAKPRRGPFRWFNAGFDWVNRRYVSGVGGMIRFSGLTMLAFAAIAAMMAVLFLRVPGGFLPDEDQAFLFAQISLPPGATAEQTDDVNRRLTDYLLTAEKGNVKSAYSVTGFNFAGQAQSAGFFAISLTDWSKRPRASQSAAAIAGRANAHFAGDRDALVFVIPPPAVLELGNAAGFDLELIDQANLGHAALIAARNQFLGMAMQDPKLAQVRPNGLEDTPQYRLRIDREKASAAGISLGDINTLIAGAFGSTYVNQFQRNGRVKQVYVQGEASGRMTPEQLGSWYLRNSTGGLVPASSIMDGSWLVGPAKVESYNGDTSVEIQGGPGRGASTGQAIAEVQSLAARLPKGVGYAWTGLSYEQVKAGSQTLALYSISAIVILFCLAALYESWAIPLAVMLVVPLGVIGAVAATLLRGLDNDVYFQVGLLTTTGLAVKNAILIVEFAKANYEAGQSLRDAALHAAQERLRPILMTSLAFVFGTFPLAVAQGAGAASRVAIGTAVVGGMISATLLAVFFVPVFFTAVLGLFRIKPKPVTEPIGRPDAGQDARQDAGRDWA